MKGIFYVLCDTCPVGFVVIVICVFSLLNSGIGFEIESCENWKVIRVEFMKGFPGGLRCKGTGDRGDVRR